jgi:hypothetical protein
MRENSRVSDEERVRHDLGVGAKVGRKEVSRSDGPRWIEGLSHLTDRYPIREQGGSS